MPAWHYQDTLAPHLFTAEAAHFTVWSLPHTLSLASCFFSREHFPTAFPSGSNQVLLQGGANASQLDRWQRTAAEEARDSRHEAVAALIASADAGKQLKAP